MLSHDSAVALLTRCLDPGQPETMLEATLILSVLCFVKPNGYKASSEFPSASPSLSASRVSFIGFLVEFLSLEGKPGNERPRLIITQRIVNARVGTRRCSRG